MHARELAVRVSVLLAGVAVCIGYGVVGMPGADVLGELLARASTYVIGGIGIPASADGLIIKVDGFAALVAAQCTGVDLLAVYGVAVVVWPASIGARLWGWVMGAVALSTLNFVRIVILMLTGANYPEYFDAAHTFVWQPIMVLATVGLWLGWWRWVSNGERAIYAGTTG